MEPHTYPAYSEKIETALANLDTELQELKATGMIEDELYTRYEAAIQEWITIGSGILSQIENNNLKVAKVHILSNCAPALDEVVKASEEIDVVTNQLKKNAILKSQIVAFAGMALSALFIFVAWLFSTKIGKAVVKSVTDPLQKIEETAKELSHGNLHCDLDYRSDDEIGRLSHNLRKAIHTLSSYVDDIACSMEKFSEGDFNVQPEVEWQGDFMSIQDSFREFERKMSVMIHDIHSVADKVTGGASRVSVSSQELAQGASGQAAVIEELTATLDNVSDMVRQNAASARIISEDVEKVSMDIVSSNQKMQEMVSSMQAISEASSEIGRIIETINEIASQTNLLALNASIEAARAGEAGKGFAVVADQVSMLASQSADAVQESSVLIEGSLRAVKEGMQIANETAQMLETAVGSSREITEKVSMIAEASEEQAESIGQIHQGVSDINDVVQSNSATSEECAVASEEMTAQAQNLEQMIRRFKVADFEL